MKSFYIDNRVTSISNEDILNRFIEESKHILATTCFDLRGWEHTSSKIRRDSSAPIPVLGLLWNTDEDNIFFDTTVLKYSSLDLTRRNVLSTVHKIFDPIDVLSPAALIPKLLIQRSWNLKIGWDTVLPDDYQREFSSWLRDVDCLLNVNIARSLNIDKIHGLSLHLFGMRAKMLIVL
ncbi:DUF5641 domain-containing protein [Nephila pilipes]|uniref:DUF5641 domain-containing protein n=1 Tax=Nephila pilipes TaxID=299642 RepID=A0A8X6QII5_NEPPI|nr:DUF5641 domain-containing protein [Nephila pilipes]